MDYLVLITSEQRPKEHGTGFIVERIGGSAGQPDKVLVVTAAHVARNLGDGQLRVQGQPAAIVADLAATQGIDLAVLEVTGPIEGTPAALAAGKAGLAIEVHGYEPTSLQPVGSTVVGRVVRASPVPARGRNAPAWAIEVDAAVAGGMSGAPVVDSTSGAVVGVVVYGSKAGKTDGVALAIENLRGWAACPPIATLAAPSTTGVGASGTGSTPQGPTTAGASPASTYAYDVFICHASEDKAAFVEPLVAALQAQGVSVWYDRFEICLGDDFRRKMDEGLGSSRFGVVVVSPRSDKYWTNTELSAFFNLEAMDGPAGEPRILPVRLDLTVAEITRRSPLLATRASLGHELGVDEVARRIAERVGDVRPTALPRSPLYNVPQRRAQNFVGREDDIAKVTALLRPGSKVGLAPAASIEGLAGIGKTELAIHTAHRLAATDRFPRGIVWLDAEQADLTAQWGGAVADSLALSPGPVDERAHSALRTFSNAGPVLVVLDNVTSWTPTGSPGPLPAGPNVAILVTSRSRKLGGGSFDHVEVERLSPDASRELLVRLAERDLARAPGFEDLLTHLDGHALALELAGAYFGAVPSSTPASYLARLTVGDDVQAKVAPQTRYARTVRQAFDATYAVLDEASRAALRVASWFAPAEASLALLQACGVGEDKLSPLRRFHLLTGGAERWSIHRLVREYGRTAGATSEQEAARDAFVDGCVEHARGIDLATGFRIYRADQLHFDHALSLGSTALAADPQRLSFFQDCLAGGAHSSGDLRRAKGLCELALASDLKNLGEDHPNVATSRANLALVLKDLGDLPQAKLLLQQALASDLKNLGEDHPAVATSRSNLAVVLQALGDLPQAKLLLQQALASYLHNLGDDHPSVATSRSNLACLLKDLGDLPQAKLLLQQALASDLKNLGVDDPSVATCRSNLALVLKALGDLPQAELLLQQALASYLHNLGDDHPSVATCRSNLAGVLQDLGDLPQAKLLLQQALASNLTNLGEDHPNVATSRFNLARLCEQDGDDAAARDLFAQALASEERSLGENNPSTASTRAALAAVKHRLGDLAGARADAARALAAVRSQPEGSHYRTQVERLCGALGIG